MTANDHRPLERAQAEGFLAVALAEARIGLKEGGIPIGAALFQRDGTLLGRGHNRRVQHDDPSVHGETDAFRNAGRRRDYSDTVTISAGSSDGITANETVVNGDGLVGTVVATTPATATVPSPGPARG